MTIYSLGIGGLTRSTSKPEDELEEHIMACGKCTYIDSITALKLCPTARDIVSRMLKLNVQEPCSTAARLKGGRPPSGIGPDPAP
jgi:hypothetical protein